MIIFLYLLETFKSVMKETCSSGMYFDYNTTNEIYSSFTIWNYIRNDYICCNCGIGSISTEDNSKECQECEQKYGANEDNTKCELCPFRTYIIQ